MTSGERADGAGRGEGRVVWLFDPAMDEDASVEAPPMSPVELYDELRLSLVRSRLHEQVAVTGTVAGLRRRGWCSFDLIQQPAGASAPQALVRVVLFAAAARRLDGALHRDASGGLEEGVTATVTGTLAWEPGWGLLRLVGEAVTILEARAPLTRARDELVEALTRSGLLGAQQRLVVPAQPARIALVVGAGTAAAADIDTVLQASRQPWRVVRRSVPMAGPDAATAISAAVAELGAERPAVIVVARGGGGRAELGCWDSAAVAEAIARCPVPVWTAIGHASDSTVADLVAHQSFATPSAAATALVARWADAERAADAAAERHAHVAQLEAQQSSRRRAWTVAAVAVLITVLVVALRLAG